MNINPCDGHNMGYGGPWEGAGDVGIKIQAFTNDFVDSNVWKKPVGYVTIARHVNGACTMTKTWRLTNTTRSMSDYFSTYPGRMYVTGDGSVNDHHISSDIPQIAEISSGTWKDPIFGAGGGLVFNWYYGDNGARIAIPGGYKIPFTLPSTGDNGDDLHGLGNEYGAKTVNGEGSQFYWHDVAKIGPDCHGTNCPVIGADHGTILSSTSCWGSYAIFVSKDASSFTCQGRMLSQKMN